MLLKTNFKLQKVKSAGDVENNIIYLKDGSIDIFIKYKDKEYNLKDNSNTFKNKVNQVPIGKIACLTSEEYKSLKNAINDIENYLKIINLGVSFKSKPNLIFLEKIKDIV